jgi:hypothetical protein
MFIAQVLWATRFDLRKKIMWLLTVIRGVRKRTTSPRIQTIFFLLLTHVATFLWPPFRAHNLFSYPPDPDSDYRTHGTTIASPWEALFCPCPLRVHEWGAGVAGRLVRLPPFCPLCGAREGT